MGDQQALIQRSIRRTGHSLPFLDPSLRDLIILIPSMLSEGELPVGIYAQPVSDRRELELLKKYLGRKPEIAMNRLPYRIMVESLIVLVRPSLANRYFATVTAICIAKRDAPVHEIEAKLAAIGDVFKSHGIPLAWLIYDGAPLPELLVYEIMLTGIVLGGKHPAVNRNADPDLCTYIGDLPGKIVHADLPAAGEWNPFKQYLDAQVTESITRGDYPSALSIPGANPFIIPYLHILHRHEEDMDAEQVEKMRTSLIYLFSTFPPTRDVMKDLTGLWKTGSSHTPLRDLSFDESLRLRKWLGPLEENELPIFSWPPPPHFSRGKIELKTARDSWSMEGFREFSHRHAWVVLVWAAASGLITRATRIVAPTDLKMKRNCRDLLLCALEENLAGTVILVPEDYSQGSIRIRDGRFFFFAAPFAILEQGKKHSLGLFEAVKKKTLIDDIHIKKDGE